MAGLVENCGRTAKVTERTNPSCGAGKQRELCSEIFSARSRNTLCPNFCHEIQLSLSGVSCC